MSNAVNLENLREMTGGDPDLERELFGVYLESSDKALRDMKQSLETGDTESWRTNAHAWKGTNLNLGAEDLARLCATAQASHLSSVEEKTQLLAAIEESYEEVRIFLKNIG